MTATRHRITVERSGSSYMGDWHADYVITFTYRPGDREPDELVFVSVEPGIGIVNDNYAQRDLEEWARDWLDDNFDRALEKALTDRVGTGGMIR